MKYIGMTLSIAGRTDRSEPGPKPSCTGNSRVISIETIRPGAPPYINLEILHSARYLIEARRVAAVE